MYQTHPHHHYRGGERTIRQKDNFPRQAKSSETTPRTLYTGCVHLDTRDERIEDGREKPKPIFGLFDFEWAWIKVGVGLK